MDVQALIQDVADVLKKHIAAETVSPAASPSVAAVPPPAPPPAVEEVPSPEPAASPAPAPAVEEGVRALADMTPEEIAGARKKDLLDVIAGNRLDPSGELVKLKVAEIRARLLVLRERSLARETKAPEAPTPPPAPPPVAPVPPPPAAAPPSVAPPSPPAAPAAPAAVPGKRAAFAAYIREKLASQSGEAYHFHTQVQNEMAGDLQDFLAGLTEPSRRAAVKQYFDLFGCEGACRWCVVSPAQVPYCHGIFDTQGDGCPPYSGTEAVSLGNYFKVKVPPAVLTEAAGTVSQHGFDHEPRE